MLYFPLSFALKKGFNTFDSIAVIITWQSNFSIALDNLVRDVKSNSAPISSINKIGFY